MWRVVLLVLLVACRSKAGMSEDCKYGFQCESGHCSGTRCTTGEPGVGCFIESDCEDGLQCYKNGCRVVGREGDTCSFDRDCNLSLTCVEDLCVPPARIESTKQAVAARKDAEARREQHERQQAEREKEARLLKESGIVEKPPVAEVALPPPGPGTRVRVVTTTAKTTAFAACRADERLTGGGCKAADLDASYPSGHGEQDTVGARWNCSTGEHNEVTAYAMCSKL